MEHMNGLKMKRLKQESISKMTTKSGLLKACVIMSVLFLTGCEDLGTTDIQWENRSDEAIKVDIRGVVPNPAGGFLPPGTGSDELMEVSLHIGGSVRFDEAITIEWTAEDGGNKRSQELKRSDFKIPATVRGGEIRFIYSAEGKWSITYK